MIQRLRTVLTNRAILFLILLVCLTSVILNDREEKTDGLERRLERTLSLIRGAGRVSVVVSVRNEEAYAKSGVIMDRSTGSTTPCGAVVVATGAEDPVVRMELTQAVCSVLGLPVSAVSVSIGEE